MNKLNQLLEDAIIGRLIYAMTDHALRVTISATDGDGTYVYGIADGGEVIPDGGYKYWVKIAEGNGADVITDYSVNLETIIAPALELARQFE